MSQKWPNDGRINLEYQRKRAKLLLRGLKAGIETNKLEQLRQLNPTAQLNLASAQWLIALELGFESWPKLKSHVDAIAFAARHPDFAADGETQTVHWRCGNDIEHSLRLAGFKGAFRELTDPLCMGPISASAEPAYLQSRSRFISDAFHLNFNDVLHRMQREYADLAKIGNTDQATVLWCEADPYDQLFLIRVLASLEHVPRRLELIEINQMPGVRRFIGIGQLAPDVLAWLWPQRQSVGEDALALARRAWLAYCSDSPVALAALALEPHASLPFLSPALRRQLQELPNHRTGLSLTEQLSLEYIAEAGEVPFGRVFAELMAVREPLPFLGDTMYEAMLRPLIDANTPLITESDTHQAWHKRPLSLTDLGHRVLAGQAYWMDHATADKWVGGVRIEPGRAHWAIGEHGQPVWREPG